VIEAAKRAVSTLDLAERLCGADKLHRTGDRFVACCPLPDHEDKTPSFTVFLKTNSWWCFGCSRGGDVIELARLAWGYEKHEAAMAAADLLRTYGHPIPERPASWFAKQVRHKPIRDGIEAAKIQVARRRLYKRYFEPIVLATEDEADRAHDAQLFWELTERLAEHLVGAMMRAQR
jgi:DNA primase